MLYGTVLPQVVSVKDYDLYCHYVAGLVGVGLSHLFASSGGCCAGSAQPFWGMGRLAWLVGSLLGGWQGVRASPSPH